LALSLVLSIPPPLLIAEPRFPDELVLIGQDTEVDAWPALFWMLGRNQLEVADVVSAEFQY
jgi:hypothetical protein